MPKFEHYILRHGESGTQSLIEMIEQREGVRGRELLPLDERWKALHVPASNDNTGTVLS